MRRTSWIASGLHPPPGQSQTANAKPVEVTVPACPTCSNDCSLHPRNFERLLRPTTQGLQYAVWRQTAFKSAQKR
eukprot:12939873-Alexandrium_andersonii.AAC.1